jgi:type IV secretory pathway VirB10-like protein
VRAPSSVEVARRRAQTLLECASSVKVNPTQSECELLPIVSDMAIVATASHKSDKIMQAFAKFTVARIEYLDCIAKAGTDEERMRKHSGDVAAAIGSKVAGIPKFQPDAAKKFVELIITEQQPPQEQPKQQTGQQPDAQQPKKSVSEMIAAMQADRQCTTASKKHAAAAAAAKPKAKAKTNAKTKTSIKSILVRSGKDTFPRTKSFKYGSHATMNKARRDAEKWLQEMGA